MPDRLVIFDTTLRDGEQAPGFSMRVGEKVRLARQLEILGVDIIEAGFPIASEDDAEAVRRVSAEVKTPVVAALARCAPGDVDRAGQCIKGARRGRIHTFIATSDLHLTLKLRISREACLDMAVAAVRRARNFTDDVEFSAEDATRSDLDFLCQRRRGRDRGGCGHGQSAGHGRLLDTRRDRRVLPHGHRPRAERRPRDFQRALP